MSSSMTGTLKRRRAQPSDEPGSIEPQMATKRRKASAMKHQSNGTTMGATDASPREPDVWTLPTDDSPVNRINSRVATPKERTPLTKRLAEVASSERKGVPQSSEPTADKRSNFRNGSQVAEAHGLQVENVEDEETPEHTPVRMSLRSGGRSKRVVWTSHGMQQSPPQKEEPIIKIPKRKKKPPEDRGDGQDPIVKQPNDAIIAASGKKRGRPVKDALLASVMADRVSSRPTVLSATNAGLKGRDSKVSSSVDSMEDELKPVESKAEKKRREQRRKKMEALWVDDSDEDMDTGNPRQPVVTAPPTRKLQTQPQQQSSITPAKPTKSYMSHQRPVMQPNPAVKLDMTNLTPKEALKAVVLQKLTHRRPVPLTNLNEEYSKVHLLLHATVSAGESNSMLLIGARGSGKTALVNAAIAAIAKDEDAGGTDAFHVVRLSGFIHTDDKIASRDIWRQLGRALEEGDGSDDNGGGPAKSYADTLTMLLALLSRPEGEETKTAPERISKSVIFIMDEFDLFASHPRQTLLYNLFDIAQSRKAPIAVLGLTTRIDVVESLEKRVKSRFSHRYVHIGLSRSLAAFQDVVKAALQVQMDELTFGERAHIAGRDHDHMDVDGEAETENVLQDWNSGVESLLDDKSVSSKYIAPVYHTTKSVPAVMTSLLIPLTKASSLQDLLQNSAVASGISKPASRITGLFPYPIESLLPPPSHLHVLPSLSDLALSLLISACRLDILYSTPLTNFSLAYAEYIELASKARLQTSSLSTLTSGVSGTRVWSRDIASAEWEKLLSYGFLVPAVGASEGLTTLSSKGGDAQMVKVDVTLEEVEMALRGSGILNATMEKWCKQL